MASESEALGLGLDWIGYIKQLVFVERVECQTSLGLGMG